MEDALGEYCTTCIFLDKGNWFLRVGKADFVIEGNGPNLKDIFDVVEEIINENGFKAKVELAKKERLAEQMASVPPVEGTLLN